MGFFSSLIGTAASVATAFATGQQPAAAPSQPSAATTKPSAGLVDDFKAAGKPSIIDLAEPTGRTTFVSGPSAPGNLSRARGGTKNRIRTVVQTIAPNGNIESQEFFEGRPFLMNKDIVQLKRTLKLIAKAEKRVPRGRRRGQAEREENAKLRGMLDGMIRAKLSLPTTQVIDT